MAQCVGLEWSGSVGLMMGWAPPSASTSNNTQVKIIL